jgi:putative tryptophan/tyrosine transport system substrate-binding protein
LPERRRFLFGATAGLAAAWTPGAHGQTKLPVVGFLLPGLRPAAGEAGRSPISTTLRELGWEDGRTVRFDPAYAQGREEQLPALAEELVARKVDLIVTSGSNGARAAARATRTIPIIVFGPDLLAMGLVQSLARPGGNITGLPNEAGQGVLAKRLEFLKRAAPGIRRVTYVRNRQPDGQSAWTEETAAAARALGLELAFAGVDTAEDLEATFRAFARSRPDALWFAGSSTNAQLRERIVQLTARERLPAVYSSRAMVETGGLMSYAILRAEQMRRVAVYIDKVLRGTPVGELPVEMPTRFELVINLKTAAALGLKIPPDLLLLADEVIRA